MQTSTHDYDLEEIRRRLPMAEVCAKEGLKLRKEGTNLKASCPFHAEQSASFNIDSRKPHKGHCFGCGWDGSVFDFWMQFRGVELKVAIEQLASLAGLSPRIQGVTWSVPNAKVMSPVTRVPRKLGEKPALPRMRELKDAEIEQLAHSRGLSVAGVAIAARTFRRVGFCTWPQVPRRDGQGWWIPEGAHPSWCVTDDTRRTAEFRRLDGLKYQRRDGDEIKAWSTRGKSWPLGAADMGHRRCVILVEGGPDMLAAYHFLHGFGRLEQVAVVSILGTSNRICAEALPYFKGTRVRIMMDADEIKERRTKCADGTEDVIRSRAGIDAAARWTDQLTEAGATVGVANMEGLVRADGQPVKDLNDLALCDSMVVGSETIADFFCEWREGFGE